MKITLQQRQNAWHTLTTIGDTARACREATNTEINKVRESKILRDEHKADKIRDLQQALADQMQQLTTDATHARDLLLTAAGELDQTPGDSAAQMLAETRQARAWDRARQLLDAGRSHLELIAAAEKNRDADTVAAFRRELPSYLVARGGGDLDTPGLHRRLDLATARALGDDQGAGSAARLRLHAAVQHPVAEAQIAIARDGRSLQGAIATRLAQTAADKVAADLGEPPADGSGSGDAA